MSTATAFNIAMVFRTDVANAKAGMAEVVAGQRNVATEASKTGAVLAKEAAELEKLAAATAKAVLAQDELAAAEKRAQTTRAQAVIAPLANPAAQIAPAAAIWRTAETAADSLRGVVAGLNVTVGQQPREFAAARQEAALYQSMLDDVRASFNPLYAASRQYEQQLERIAEAERISAISAREAAAARVAAANAISPAMPGGAGVSNISTMHTANIGAQGFDIGVTAAMGMNPAMIGIQQGSQLVQVMQQMGGGKQALQGLAAGFMSILNPMSLATIAAVTFGAAAIQWLTKSGAAAKSFEDGLSDLIGQIKQVDEANKLARASGSDLAATFGRGAAGIRPYLQELAALERKLAGISAEGSMEALSDKFRSSLLQAANPLSNGQFADIFDIGRFNADGLGKAAAVQAGADELLAAKTIEAQIAGLDKLIPLIEAAADASGKRSKEETELLQSVVQQRVELEKLKATDENSAGKAAARETQLQLERQAALQGQIAQYGQDSAEVRALELVQLKLVTAEKLRAQGFDSKTVQFQKQMAAIDAEFAAKTATAAAEKARQAQAQQDAIIGLQRELQLLGATSAERIRATALAEAEAEIRDRRLRGLDAELTLTTAIAKAEAQIALDRGRKAFDLETAKLMDQYDLRSGLARNPMIRADIEAEREYVQQLRDGADAGQARAEADRVRARAMDDLVLAQDQALRGQAERIQAQQLELALIGQTAEVRARILALVQAERQITETGATGEIADRMRKQALVEVEYASVIEAQADAWKRVQAAGEASIDAVLDKLKGGDMKGAVASLVQEISDGFFELSVSNPLKNLLLGTNLGTLDDLGGLSGMWDRLTGKAGLDERAVVKAASQQVQAMTVAATMVTINAAGINMTGASGLLAGLPGAANTSIAPQPADAAAQAILSGAAFGGGARPGAIANLDGALAGPLAAMVTEAKRLFGDSAVQINSAWRSTERQSQLWQEALAKYGSPEAARKWVAPPGRSKHNSGLAADLGYGSPDVQRWFHENAASYGLTYRMQNEPWHIEAAGGARGRQGIQTSGADQALAAVGTAAQAVVAPIGQMGQTSQQTTSQMGQLGQGMGQFGGILGQMASGLAGAVGGEKGGFLNLLLSIGDGLAKGVPLFSAGGATPAGNPAEVGGIVHKSEYVFDAVSTRRIGVQNLEALRQGTLRGFRSGGYVGAMPAPGPASNSDWGPAGNVTFAPNFDLRGAQDPAAVEAAARRGMEEALRRYDRTTLPGRVKQISAKPRNAN